MKNKLGYIKNIIYLCTEQLKTYKQMETKIKAIEKEIVDYTKLLDEAKEDKDFESCRSNRAIIYGLNIALGILTE